MQRALAELDIDPEFQILTPQEFDLDESGNLRYTLEIHNNVSSPDGSAILSPDNTWVPPGAAWVRSRGYLGGVGSYQSSGLIALVARARPVFDHAIFAEDSIRILNGGRVDCYDSTVGFAMSQSQMDSPKTAAHLATNSSAAGAIQVTTAEWVDGNMYSGLGSTPGAVIQGGSQGDSLQLDEEKDVFRFRTTLPVSNVPLEIPWLHADGEHWVFPWETDPEQANGNPHLPREASYGSLRVRANNPDWHRATNIFSGEYFVSQGLVFDTSLATVPDAQNTRIDVHANDEFPAVIYVAGDVTLNAVRLNTRQINGNDPTPRRLQIYMLNEGSTFRMTGGSEVHALVAGQGITVHLDGGSELFGAVIGGRVTVDNAQVHYDTTLPGIAQNGRTAWDILALKEASGAEATQVVGDPAQAPPQPPSIQDVALDPVQGTRDGGYNAVTPQEDPELTDFREVIPREEIEEGWEPEPDPNCGTCGGIPGGGGQCGEAGCPGHDVCAECGLGNPPCGVSDCDTCGGAGGGPGGVTCGEAGCPGHGPCEDCGDASPDCGACGTCGGAGGSTCDTPGCTSENFCPECNLQGPTCNNPPDVCDACGVGPSVGCPCGPCPNCGQPYAVYCNGCLYSDCDGCTGYFMGDGSICPGGSPHIQ